MPSQLGDQFGLEAVHLFNRVDDVDVKTAQQFWLNPEFVSA